MAAKDTKINVLYVDDERNNLNSFKALLRFDYNIHLCENVDDAVVVLENHPEINVVISDQKMPGKTGVEFFEQLSKDYPLPVRMLLTGYADMEAVIDAINKGRVFRYITKPWNEFEIKSAIEEAYQYYISNSLLKVKNEELLIAYDELDHFSHTVTHDIRGPIVSTLSALELLQSISDIDEIRKFLSILEKSMKQLNSFIVKTHSYHRMKRGPLDISEINFQALVAGIKDVYDIERRLKGVDFNIDIDQQGSFKSDEILICLVIDNLLSNAFKYAKISDDPHAVSLKITVIDGNAEIIIIDNGIGINEKHFDQIFELFYRGDGESIAFGSGFGLYNVNRAIKRLNGAIHVASEVNAGSTFTVNISSKN